MTGVLTGLEVFDIANLVAGGDILSVVNVPS